MSSTMTFALPVRTQTPSSMMVDPVFSLLYEGKEKSLAHLINHQAPLPLVDAVKDSAFMDYILGNEPGPKIQYQHLRPALTSLRPFLLDVSYGQELIAFYRELLRIQGLWAIATAEMLIFNTYVKMMHALGIESNDEKLVRHITALVPGACPKIKVLNSTNRIFFDQIVSVEKTRLAKASQVAAENLFKLKVSTEFWRQYGRLVVAIECSEKRLAECRASAAHHREVQFNERAIAQAGNEATLTRQMGMNGTAPYNPQVEAAAMEWVRGMKNEIFVDSCPFNVDGSDDLIIIE